MEESKDVWGPRLWKEIHSISLKNNPIIFKKFLNSLPNKIPCKECKLHFREYMRTHPVTKDTVRWGIDFHNSVNRRIGKKILSYKEANALIRKDSVPEPLLVPQLCVLSSLAGIMYICFSGR